MRNGQKPGRADTQGTEAGTPLGLSKSFAERGENWAGPGEEEESHFQEKESSRSQLEGSGNPGAWAVGVAGPGRERAAGVEGRVRIGMEKLSGLPVWGWCTDS